MYIHLYTDIIDLMCESRSDNNNAGEASLEVRVLFANNSWLQTSQKGGGGGGGTQVIAFQRPTKTCLKSPDAFFFSPPLTKKKKKKRLAGETSYPTPLWIDEES